VTDAAILVAALAFVGTVVGGLFALAGVKRQVNEAAERRVDDARASLAVEMRAILDVQKQEIRENRAHFNRLAYEVSRCYTAFYRFGARALDALATHDEAMAAELRRSLPDPDTISALVPQAGADDQEPTGRRRG